MGKPGGFELGNEVGVGVGRGVGVRRRGHTDHGGDARQHQQTSHVAECSKIASRTHPASSARATNDKSLAGVNDDVADNTLTAVLPRGALRLFLTLGVGHRQGQRQFFQRALLGCDAEPQFDEA
jgi:hypothetical protein